ncbi:uncharacterized protein LOC133190122 [Saccostrea echinata]|uniref:uncharacterized protein LOC133190122 n=1 Tax=Saccostrea echinata TaxID=191078 RepID=UPI002A7FFFDB|nr:uncharacterized protein LOC133190122 [Saccostrea echinata]
MNKAIILIGTTCLLAIAIAQVSAYYGNTMMLGTGVGYPSSMVGGVGNVAARSNYYDNYYRQYERYNRAQAARTINKSVNGLQTSALLSLFSLFGLAMIATNTTGTLAG